MKALAYLFGIIFLLQSHQPLAQSSFVTEVDKKSMGINQQLRVSFTMNDDGDNFIPPSFSDFNVVGGPMQSVSTTWINGARSFKKSYVYQLAPKKKGTLTIGSAAIEINNKIHKTEPITITVGDAVKEEPRQRQQNPWGWGSFFGDEEPQQPQIDSKNIGQGIHLVAEVSNPNPYLNEPITVTYKLYVSHESGIRGMQLTNAPKFQNFWNHTVSEKEMKVTTGKYQGKEYRVALIQQSVLLPQKEGKLTLEPLEFEMAVEEMTGRYDRWGRPQINVSKKRFTTGTKVINVKPLPLQNQPADFTGAVGNYTFSAKVNKNTAKANEPIELTVTASGKGNLQLFTLPKPIAPSALEIYDPESSDNILKDVSSGMNGSKTDKYIIVPQYKGQYTIQPITFSYFDTNSKTYKTITTDEIVVDVTEGPELPTNEPKKEDLKASDEFQDIIKDPSLAKSKTTSDFYRSNLFYSLLFAPVLIIPLILLVDRKRRERLQDVSGAKIRKNNRLAKKYLGEAKRMIGEKEPFYEALERCLHNFMKARLHIETSEMSEDNIDEVLQKLNISESTIEAFLEIKATCEMARYSPFNIENMKNDFDKAVEVITSLEKQIKA